MNKDIDIFINPIMPIKVLSDDNLTFLERLILLHIISLCKQKGYCWATNNYFSEIYKVSRTTISKSINQLASCNYIKLEYENKNQNNSKRIIKLSDSLNLEINRIKENLNTRYKDNFKQYNKKIYNQIDNIYYKYEEGNEYWHGIKVERKETTDKEREYLRNLINEITK